MTPLTLEEALEMYKLLKDYLPDEVDSIIGTAQGILDGVQENESDRDYIEAVSMMSRIPVDILVRRSSDEILEMFLEGLSINNIEELKSFCEGIGM